MYIYKQQPAQETERKTMTNEKLAKWQPISHFPPSQVDLFKYIICTSKSLGF